MAWQDEMFVLVRVLVNDFEAARFSDDSIERLIVASAKFVAEELSFPFVATMSQLTITPDPTVDPNKDDSFVNLVCLKSACIADRGAAILATKQAIAVRDGTSSIDLRGPMQGQLELLSKGWCAVYEEARIQLLSGAGGNAGAAVMGPFRLFANGSYSNSNSFNTGRGPQTFF